MVRLSDGRQFPNRDAGTRFPTEKPPPPPCETDSWYIRVVFMSENSSLSQSMHYTYTDTLEERLAKRRRVDSSREEPSTGQTSENRQT